MELWWESLTILERIAVYIAAPATLILFIQTLLQLFGAVGGIGGDADLHDGGEPHFDLHGGGESHFDLHDGEHVGHDGAEHTDSGPSFFTVRGYVTFFTIFGWCFLALSRSGTTPGMALAIAFILGAAAMVLTGFVLYWSLKLQSDGTVHLANAVGQTGRVYLTVPAARGGLGKVNVVIQERYTECDAVSDEEEAIETGAEVVVTGVTGRNMLIVRRKRPANHT